MDLESGGVDAEARDGSKAMNGGYQGMDGDEVYVDALSLDSIICGSQGSTRSPIKSPMGRDGDFPVVGVTWLPAEKMTGS